jgi:hypothetical protein
MFSAWIVCVGRVMASPQREKKGRDKRMFARGLGR